MAYISIYRKISFVSAVIVCAFSYYYFGNAKIFYSVKNRQFKFILENDIYNESYHVAAFSTRWNVILDDLNLLNVKTLNDEEVFSSTPVIVTAISSNHIVPYKRFLQVFENVYNNNKLIYLYDLGLNNSERTQLMQEFGHIIKEIRKFTFEKYPPYVRNLRQFRWKPLAVADLLKEFPSVWWMDASARVLKPLDHFYKVYKNCTTNTCKFYPWVLITWATHGLFAATDKRMYDYLPMPIEISKKVKMWSATIQLIFATKEVREKALRYWVLCALEEGCMDPPGSAIFCKFGPDRFEVHAGCNRQDQSAINIILSRLNNFTEDKYSRQGEGVIEVKKDQVFLE